MAVPATSVGRAHKARVPRIVVALAHPTMRRYVCDLIEQGCRCWLATTAPDRDELAEAVAALSPDVVIIDAAGFPSGATGAASLPADQMLVVGSEPDDAYQQAASRAGAGGWVSRDRLPDQLLPELCHVLESCGCGCTQPTTYR